MNRAVPYPTTLIILALIGSVTTLGWQGTIDGAAVTSIFGAIVSGVLVGHYVKTTQATNGGTPTPPGGTTTTTSTTTAPPAPADGDTL